MGEGKEDGQGWEASGGPSTALGSQLGNLELVGVGTREGKNLF